MYCILAIWLRISPTRIEDEVGEHEVDHRPRADHRGAAAQPDETAFANRRVTEPVGPEPIVEPDRRPKVPAPFADPLAHDEDRRFGSISEVRASSVACIQVVSRRPFAGRVRWSAIGNSVGRGCTRGWPRSMARARGLPRQSATASRTARRFRHRSRRVSAARPLIERVVPQPGDRAAGLPAVDFLAGAIAEIPHAFGVWPRAIRFAFE